MVKTPLSSLSIQPRWMVTILVIIVILCLWSENFQSFAANNGTRLVFHEPARETMDSKNDIVLPTAINQQIRDEMFPQLLPHVGLPNPLMLASRLLFRIRWWKIQTGYAEMTIRPVTESGFPSNCVTIDIHAWTTPFFSKFFNVDDHISTVLDTRSYRPLLYQERIHEGSYRRKRVYSFNHVHRQVMVNDKTYAISSSSLCPLSAFMIMRLVRIGTNMPVSLDVFANNRGYQLEFTVDRLETLSTEFGSFLCFQLTPTLSLRGKTMEENSRLRLWFTADENRFPIRLETSVKVGTITATLIAIDPTDEDVHRLTRSEH